MVLNFLYALKHASIDCDIPEPTALGVLKKFLVRSLQIYFLAYLCSAFDGSRRGIVLSYPDAIYWLLLNYPTDSLLLDAFRAFQRMRQSSNETEEIFARRVREQARLMVRIFDDPQSLRISSMASSPTSGSCCRNGLTKSRTCVIKRERLRRRITGMPVEENVQ